MATILEMAKELTLAAIQAGDLGPEHTSSFLSGTYATLCAMERGEQNGTTTPQVQAPVDWRKSITRHAISCLICGESFKQLSVRHLRHHDTEPRAYRRQFGIPMAQPLSGKATTARRREVVQATRPWEKAPTYIKGHSDMAEAAEMTEVQSKRSGRKKATAKAS